MPQFRLLFDKNLVINRYRWQISLIAYACLSASVAWYVTEILHGSLEWKVGDWLINYQGGLVRRGFIGELIWMLAQFRINPVWLLVALQTAVYVSIIHISLVLLFRRERQISWLALLFSPAFVVLFPLYTLEGGFRKEILCLLAFALLLVAKHSGRWRPAGVAIALFAYAVAVFSHETAVFCLPFFVWALAADALDSRPRKVPDWRWPTAFAVVAMLGALLTFLRPGSWEVVRAICDSVMAQGVRPEACIGAMEQLPQNLQYAISSVREIGSANNYWLLYPLTAVLAILPIAATDWARRRALILAACALAIAPLFVLAIDWGRWLHLYFSLAILLLLRESVDLRVSMLAVPGWVVATYVSLWSMPLCCIPNMPVGIMQYGRRALNWLSERL
jgi:hypothetical protein